MRAPPRRQRRRVDDAPPAAADAVAQEQARHLWRHQYGNGSIPLASNAGHHLCCCGLCSLLGRGEELSALAAR